MSTYYVKDLVKGFIKWLLIVLLGLNVILWVTVATKCQTHYEDHTDSEEWEDSVRYRIADITEVNGDIIFWKKPSKYEVKIGRFYYDGSLKTEREWSKKPLGCFQMWYCYKHDFVYILNPIDKKYCGR
jgi:hypothetical protein